MIAQKPSHEPFFKFAWGLTGGIASGKSETRKIFESLGFVALDADSIARDLRQKGGRAYDQIAKIFGTTDSKEIRKVIFSDSKKKLQLENILHPMILDESNTRIQSHESNGVQVIYEASLLFETERDKQFQGIILVTSPKEKRINRLSEARKISEEEAKKILFEQEGRLPESQKRALAQFTIENDGSLSQLKSKVLEIAKKIKIKS